MKRIMVNFSDRLIQRASAGVILLSLNVAIRTFLVTVGIALLLIVLASLADIFSSTTAWALVVGVFAGLLVGAAVLINSYWHNWRHAREVFRKGPSKTVEIEFNNNGCHVSFGDWSRLLPWTNFAGIKQYDDLVMLKFVVEKSKLNATEIRELASNLAVREGGTESLGFPILCLLPLPKYQFVAIPAGADTADLKAYVPQR